MSFPFWHKLKYIVEYFLFLFAFKHCVHHFSHALFYYFCIWEWFLVLTQNPHHSKWALCCFLLLCHRCDKNPACSLIWRFYSIYFLLFLHLNFEETFPQNSYSSSQNFKLEIFLTWVLCWLEGEKKCNFFSQLFLELPIFTVHLTFSGELRTRHFHAI